MGGTCKIPPPGSVEACLVRGALGEVCSAAKPCTGRYVACVNGCCENRPE